MKFQTILLIISLVIVISYIIGLYWSRLRETFINSEDLNYNALLTSNIDPTHIDAGQFYQDILKSDDLIVSSNLTSNMQFEILDEIVSDSNNHLRAIQFEKLQRQVMPPQTSNTDLRQIYNSNFFDISMHEQSMLINLQQYQDKNKISIDDPISDAYLPYSRNVFDTPVKTPEQANYEYLIISMFKNVLDRNPSASEIHKYASLLAEGDLDESLLRINLLNTVEYRRNIALQSNGVSADLEYSYAKEDLISYINKLYFMELNKEPHKKMLLPLRDMYVFLQSNEYLFRALLIHDKYVLFEKDVMSARLLTKANISDIFNKYYILYDLKLIANDIKRSDILERGNRDNNNRKSPPVIPIVSVSSTTNPMTIDSAKQNQDSSKMFNKILLDSDNVFDLNDIMRMSDNTKSDDLEKDIPLFVSVNDSNYTNV